MTWRAEITTTWTGTGAQDDDNRPQLGDDYALRKWEDVTGQPSANLRPDPNLYVVRVECEEAVLDAIEADADYLVLWSEEIAEEVV